MNIDKTTSITYNMEGKICLANDILSWAGFPPTALKNDINESICGRWNLEQKTEQKTAEHFLCHRGKYVFKRY